VLAMKMSPYDLFSLLVASIAVLVAVLRDLRK
jgi:hypothetical protein